MKKTTYMIAVICGLMFAFHGCQNSDATIYQNAMSSHATSKTSSLSTSSQPQSDHKKLQGQLSVKSYWDTKIGECAADFIKLHPDVKIDVTQPAQDADEMETFNDYFDQVVVELMSGNAADVIDLSGFSVHKYAKSGLLCNLYDFIEQDPGFHLEDYYTNIFKAKEFNEGLYSMPCGFSYDMVYVSKPLLEKARISCPAKLNYKMMFDIYNRVVRTSDVPPRLLPGLTQYTFFYYEFPDYYDMKTRQASFNSNKFIEYLVSTQNMIPIDTENDLTRVAYTDEFMEKDYLFCLFDISGGFDIYNFLIDFENITPPIPLLSVNGKACFRTMRDYAIPENCENKELAWEFIKFYIGEKELPDLKDKEASQHYISVYSCFVPINIKNFYKSFRFNCEYFYSYMDRDVSNWKDVDREAVIQETLDQINGWNKQRNTEESEGEIYAALCEDW